MSDQFVQGPEGPIKLREGDVFQFVYGEEARKKWRQGGDPYWAFDGQLVFRNGRFFDTYWGLTGGDSRNFTPAEAQVEGILRFVCNLKDVRRIQEYERDHYADQDIFDLSHQHRCYKYFVVRCGASHSGEKKIEVLRKRIFEARQKLVSETECTINRVETWSRQIAEIEGGKVNLHI